MVVLALPPPPSLAHILLHLIGNKILLEKYHVTVTVTSNFYFDDSYRIHDFLFI